MMKRYCLFVLLSVFSVGLVKSQTLGEWGYPQAVLKAEVKRQESKNSKSPGTVLYSEDFDSTGNSANNGLPSGWTAQDLTGTGFNWIWSNSAPGGQYSTTIGPLQSTTGNNGYLLLPSDYYNTPWPTTGPISMDASITSPQITIPATGSVLLRFEQYYRYCCGSFSDLVVEVSNDGINWTSYDITLGRSNSSSTPNPEQMEFNVSAVLGNQTTAYIRFRQTTASHYFFMVDDLELIEGYSNALGLIDYKIEFGSSHSIKPLYTEFPAWGGIYPLNFEIEVENLGSNTLTGVKGVVEIIHDSGVYTNQALGIIRSSVDSSVNPLPSLAIDTFNSFGNLSTSFSDGYYRFAVDVESDSVNQYQGNNRQEYSFTYGDHFCARDRNNFTLNTGPDRFVGANGVGDRWGVLYDWPINSSIGGYVQSVYIFVANDSQNIGVGIIPRIWSFDELKSTLDSAIVEPPIGASPFTTTITGNMLGTWMSVPVFPPMIVPLGQQFVVGWEQTAGANSLLMGRDLSMEEYSPLVSNFVYLNDASPGWGWVTHVAGVRLDVSFPFNLQENDIHSSLSVSPNPSSGQFVIYLKLNELSEYTLMIRNTLGQVILKEQVLVGDNYSKNIDLSNQKAGIYFVSLENESERIVRKVVIQ